MSNLTISLDDVLNATVGGSNGTNGHGGPVILSEQHNANAINWVAGMSDPGEMLRCGYLPELRRRDGESDTVYAARLEVQIAALPANVRAELEKVTKAAAIRRAGLDTSNGRVNVVVAGEPAWHGLGVNVRDAMLWHDAYKLAGLDWTVSAEPLYRSEAASVGDFETIANRRTSRARWIRRNDTGAELGVVGPKFHPIQNEDTFTFVDRALAKVGAKFVTAGSLYGGAKTFALVSLPGASFKVNGNDWTEAYGLFTNAHDGSEAGLFFPTGNRVVCGNTRRVARLGRDGKGYSFRHTKNVRAAMDLAETAISEALDAFKSEADEAATLAATKLSADQVNDYFDGLLDAVCDVTKAEALKGADALAAAVLADEAERAIKAKQIQKQITKRENLFADMLARLESERCAVNGDHGTAWGVYNAATESVNHGPLGGRFNGDATVKASRRFDSLTTGDGDRIMQDAYGRALALAK